MVVIIGEAGVIVRGARVVQEKAALVEVVSDDGYITFRCEH